MKTPSCILQYQKVSLDHDLFSDFRHPFHTQDRVHFPFVHRAKSIQIFVFRLVDQQSVEFSQIQQRFQKYIRMPNRFFAVGEGDGTGCVHVQHFGEFFPFAGFRDGAVRINPGYGRGISFCQITDFIFGFNGRMRIGQKSHSGKSPCSRRLPSAAKVFFIFQTGIVEIGSQVEPADRYFQVFTFDPFFCIRRIVTDIPDNAAFTDQNIFLFQMIGRLRIDNLRGVDQNAHFL